MNVYLFIEILFLHLVSTSGSLHLVVSLQYRERQTYMVNQPNSLLLYTNHALEQILHN